MYYCFFCGGKLPESKRGTFFVEPSLNEVDDIVELMVGVTHIPSLRAVLGEPDKTELLNDNADIKARYIYNSRWKTLSLIVKEHTDGSITYSLHPKYIDNP